jgi:hypothetical protein
MFEAEREIWYNHRDKQSGNESAAKLAGKRENAIWPSRLVACTSLLRARRWLDGVRYGISSGNYSVFAASLRGFIESTADNVDVTRYIGKTLELNYVRQYPIHVDPVQTVFRAELKLEELARADLENIDVWANTRKFIFRQKLEFEIPE